MTAPTEAHAALDLDDIEERLAHARSARMGFSSAAVKLCEDDVPALLAIARREPDLLRERDLLRRTAAFVYLWVFREGLTDAERICVIKHRPGWDKFIAGAEPSDELTEHRNRADALAAQLEADRVCKESLQTERDALATQLAEKDALLREAEARCAELVEVLKPFAKDGSEWESVINGGLHDGTTAYNGGCCFTVGDLRRAARLTSPTIQADQATKVGEDDGR